MKKIYFVLILCVSSFGHSLVALGAANQNCASFLEDVESLPDTAFSMYGSFAQGTLMTFNWMSENNALGIKDGDLFEPDTNTMERVLVKHCEENLTQMYFEAVLAIWFINAK